MADASPPSEPVEVRLRDLRLGSGPVEIVARVLRAERREITRSSDGGRRSLLSGLLSDGTATVRFTWWDPPREGVERGDVLRAVAPEVREFRGRTELSFGWKTRVGPASEAELPVVRPEEIPSRGLKDLTDPMEGFRVVARVVRVAERSVTVGDERRVVYDGLLADGGATVGFSAWVDFRLRSGEAVEIVGAYVREFRGTPQLVLDERASVRRVEGTDLPTPATVLDAPPVAIAQLEDTGGAASASVQGVVVGLLPPSGLVYRCPRCRRSVQDGTCREHGPVTGIPDLRARLVLDDGTGALTVNADRATTERLWGTTLEQVLSGLRDRPDPAAWESSLLEAVFGRRLRVRGSATRDDFGVTLQPDTVEPAEVDLDASADRLSARLGDGRR